ncbi:MULTISPECIES: hypothetical protein [Bacillus]|uniref:DUF5659 domain-containing protein n=1 Tax=Bacillus cereus TaxID=1396 RepID=A0A9X5VAQ1_BACCE|nr:MULTISPECIES: hypothetical protein [Bacillus cereus group]EEK77864.1 hypothetical protein bcere0009_32920 [Bacillus cereus R309803]HDR4562217.1 hypothetical protein [Bacillus luti]AJG58068.1 hypothetical protein AW22_1004 [Bacillus cereus D17]AQQ64327.1 hypothetical Protein FORC21_3532 [Bacillus cereus]MCQ6334329.1 hypothetical protein [Bacillus cereus]
MKNITAKDLFFCYNKQVAKFLRYEKNIEFITKAYTKVGVEFYLFQCTDELEKALAEYKDSKK